MRPVIAWFASYWEWTSSGPLLRWTVGVGVPLAAFLYLFSAFSGGNSGPAENGGQDVDGRDIGVRSVDVPDVPEGLGIAPTLAAGEGGGVLDTEETSDSAPTPVGLTYLVESGDSLSAICAQFLGALPPDECATGIVQLNQLDDAAEIAVGQELILPGSDFDAVATSSEEEATPEPDDADDEEEGSLEGPTEEPEDDFDIDLPAAADDEPSTGVTAMNSAVNPGETVSISITTPPGVGCNIAYRSPSGAVSTNDELLIGTDESGANTEWLWEVTNQDDDDPGEVWMTCEGEPVSVDFEIS